MTTLIHCQGCDSKFSPQGLSQHVSKSQDPRCQHAPITSQDLVLSLSIHHSSMPPPLNQIGTPPSLRDNTLDTRYELVNDIQLSDGAFAVTCVAIYLHSMHLNLALNYR